MSRTDKTVKTAHSERENPAPYPSIRCPVCGGIKVKPLDGSKRTVKYEHTRIDTEICPHVYLCSACGHTFSITRETI